jgi:hypothetical protein
MCSFIVYYVIQIKAVFPLGARLAGKRRCYHFFEYG